MRLLSTIISSNIASSTFSASGISARCMLYLPSSFFRDREKKRESMCGGRNRQRGERISSRFLTEPGANAGIHMGLNPRTLRSQPELKPRADGLTKLSHSEAPIFCLLILLIIISVNIDILMIIDYILFM